MSDDAAAREESGFAHVYTVELLYREPPALDAAALRASLEAKLGALDVLDAGDPNFHYAFHALPVEYANGDRLPAQLVVMSVPMPGPESFAPSLQQTWDWDGAASAVAEARHALLVSDFVAAGLRPADRLRLLLAGVAAVIERAPPSAVHWKVGQRLLDPAAFAARAAEDPISVAVNVRKFDVSDRLAGETVMDTLGLAAVGIPDFQVHFVGLDPGRVAGFLYAMSRYVHQRGAVIAHGHTVPGPKPGEKWQVRSERALFDPGRVVLDVDPNPPHSARGNPA